MRLSHRKENASCIPSAPPDAMPPLLILILILSLSLFPRVIHPYTRAHTLCVPCCKEEETVSVRADRASSEYKREREREREREKREGNDDEGKG